LNTLYINIYTHTHSQLDIPSYSIYVKIPHIFYINCVHFCSPILINDSNNNILGLPFNLVVPKFINNTLLENKFPKRVLYMSLGTTRLRGRPRNRWQDEVREDGRIVGVEGWQEKVHKREEWKKLLRTARNCRILHMPME
jgi:hypothetical protein